MGGLLEIAIYAVFFTIISFVVFDAINDFSPNFNISINFDAIYHPRQKNERVLDGIYSSYLTNEEISEAIDDAPKRIEEYLDNNPFFVNAFKITESDIERMHQTPWQSANSEERQDDPNILALHLQPMLGTGYIQFFFDRIEETVEEECAYAGDYSSEYIRQMYQQIAAHEYMHALLDIRMFENQDFLHYEEDVVQLIAESIFPIYTTTSGWNAYTPGARVANCILQSYGPEYGWRKLFQYVNHSLIEDDSDIITHYNKSCRLGRGDYYIASANNFLQEVYRRDTPSEEIYIEKPQLSSPQSTPTGGFFVAILTVITKCGII